MQDSPQVTLRRAYAWLEAMATNMPIPAMEEDVDRFNSVVDDLARLGYRVESFRIDKRKEMRDPIQPGRRRMTPGPILEMHALTFKTYVDALRRFFELTQSDTHVVVLLDIEGSENG